MDKLSTDVPPSKRDQKPLDWLEQLATEWDRSVNDLAVQAILAYIESMRRSETAD
ncbi:MAG: hypothetical protein ABEK03_09870 [Candidatus Bipolaricaulia bacterium]